MVLDLTDGKWRSWLFVIFILYLLIKQTSPKQPDYQIDIHDRSKQYSEKIYSAFDKLAKACPNVKSQRVTKISAQYFDEVYEYMSREYQGASTLCSLINQRTIEHDNRHSNLLSSVYFVGLAHRIHSA